MTRVARSTEERIALRLARLGGIALSAEEFEDSLDEPDSIQDASGAVNMEKLLAQLLRALGIAIPDVGEGEFKMALYEAAMSKIKDLTSRGQGAGAGNANPLIQQEQQPMFMSLLDKLGDENEYLKLKKHELDLASAAATPPRLSPEEEARIVETLARRMGCAVEEQVSLSLTDAQVDRLEEEEKEDALAAVLVGLMPASAVRSA
jgi:hypothetical protein